MNFIKDIYYKVEDKRAKWWHFILFYILMFFAIIFYALPFVMWKNIKYILKGKNGA
jgi:hypothetical protein